MARPRKTSGKSTPFGKRSEAEKSFRDRKKRSGRGSKEETPTSRFKRDHREERQSFRTRDNEKTDRQERPYGKKSNSLSSERPSRFGKGSSQRDENRQDKPFGKRSFSRNENRDDKPLGKRSFSRNENREDKPFAKRSFSRNENRDDKPLGKRSFSRNQSRDDKPFGKRSFSRNQSKDDKPFEKRSTSSFRSEDGFRDRKKPYQRSSSTDNSEKGDFIKKTSGEASGSKGTNYGLPYKRKTVIKKRSFTSSRHTQEKANKKDSDLIRLNKFLANSGVGSRREADELIRMGLVTVNGETITEMGHKIKPTDEVRYEGRKLKAEKPVYILLNKPKGFITTTDDPQERNTVMSLVANAGKERIYPVGRLDRNTTGLLLLTNDGDLADKLTHPSYNVRKIYRVELDKAITKNDFIKIKEGIYLEEGKAVVDDLAIVDGDSKTIGIELHIGWNRIVRRIFESLGYQVVKLDRVAYAGLDKKDIARGQWRFLKPEEVVMLKHFK